MKLTQKRLKELLHYNQDTGVFVWVVGRSGVKAPGTVAGGVDKNGYMRIMVDQVTYKLHRLAWLYVKGYFPENMVDHDDGNTLNNSFSNLKEANHVCNGQNRKLGINNKSGCVGVNVVSPGVYRATITVNKKACMLGTGKDLLEAMLRRYTAEQWSDGWTCHGQCMTVISIRTLWPEFKETP